MSDLITVATFGEVLQAQMCRAALSAGGVRAFVADEHISTLNPHYVGAASGIRVQVRRADLARALEILKHEAEESAAAGDRDEDEDETEHDDGPRCPRCEARYAYFEWSHGQLLAIVLLLGIPLLFLKKAWHCRRCDHRFLPVTGGDRPESPYRKPRRSTQAKPGS